MQLRRRSCACLSAFRTRIRASDLSRSDIVALETPMREGWTRPCPGGVLVRRSWERTRDLGRLRIRLLERAVAFLLTHSQAGLREGKPAVVGGRPGDEFLPQCDRARVAFGTDGADLRRSRRDPMA